MELAGREVERDAVLRSVRFAAGAVIAGEAGVGKSALAAAVADQLADQGVPVIRILATAASRSIPTPRSDHCCRCGPTNFTLPSYPG